VEETRLRGPRQIEKTLPRGGCEREGKDKDGERGRHVNKGREWRWRVGFKPFLCGEKTVVHGQGARRKSHHANMLMSAERKWNKGGGLASGGKSC
jgi:hypothetical protein